MPEPTKTQEIIRGQGGVPVPVNETRFATDTVILDPNSPLAVQIPEDSDADRSLITVPLADSLAEGRVEAKFGTEAAPLPVSATGEEEGTRAAGENPGGEHTPDFENTVGPEYHNESALARAARDQDEVTTDVEAESPASSKDEPEAPEPQPAKGSVSEDDPR